MGKPKRKNSSLHLIDDTLEEGELKNVPPSIIPPITQVYQLHPMAWPKQTRSGQMYRCCQPWECQLICDKPCIYDHGRNVLCFKLTMSK
jgi:hypothetical protein